jgi:hypothetical protein
MKSVNQYDLEGNFIKEWSSISDIKIKFPSSDITYACKDFKRTSCGYKWKYKN